VAARSLESMRKQALSLPLEQRAELARAIMASLDGPPDPSAASSWEVELCRRINDLRSGKAALLEPEDVIEGIRGRLKTR
jgi:putative addiction module component (TIGR02574 family)